MSRFLPPADKITYDASFSGVAAVNSSGVTAFAIRRQKNSWQSAVNAAVVKEPPEPTAISGSDEARRRAFANGAMSAFFAHSYVSGRLDSSESYGLPKLSPYSKRFSRVLAQVVSPQETDRRPCPWPTR